MSGHTAWATPRTSSARPACPAPVTSSAPNHASKASSTATAPAHTAGRRAHGTDGPKHQRGCSRGDHAPPRHVPHDGHRRQSPPGRIVAKVPPQGPLGVDLAGAGDSPLRPAANPAIWRRPLQKAARPGQRQDHGDIGTHRPGTRRHCRHLIQDRPAGSGANERMPVGRKTDGLSRPSTPVSISGSTK